MKRMLPGSLLMIVVLIGIIALTTLPACSEGTTPSTDKKKEDPKINWRFELKPKAMSPGESGTLTLFIETARGIKLTNYPQTTIVLSGDKEAVFEKSAVKLGDGKMPDDLMKNYLGSINPIEFRFRVDEKVSRDTLSIVANISYFCCEMKSGICWPGSTTVDLKIPLKKK